jgi:hypothetical protein
MDVMNFREKEASELLTDLFNLLDSATQMGVYELDEIEILFDNMEYLRNLIEKNVFSGSPIEYKREELLAKVKTFHTALNKACKTPRVFNLRTAYIAKKVFNLLNKFLSERLLKEVKEV